MSEMWVVLTFLVTVSSPDPKYPTCGVYPQPTIFTQRRFAEEFIAKETKPPYIPPVCKDIVWPEELKPELYKAVQVKLIK